MAMASIQNHNRTVLESLQPGDTVEIKRGLYSHWLLYIREGRVIHLAGNNDGLTANVNSGSMFTICGKEFNKASVKEDDYWNVVGDSYAYKNNSKDRTYRPCAIDEILERARKMVGEVGYNVLWQNCEHFASYCRYGKAKSDQADNLLTYALIGAAAAGGVALAVGALRNRNSEKKHSTE